MIIKFLFLIKKKESLLFDFFILSVIMFQSVFVQSYKHVFELHSKQKSS